MAPLGIARRAIAGGLASTRRCDRRSSWNRWRGAARFSPRSLLIPTLYREGRSCTLRFRDHSRSARTIADLVSCDQVIQSLGLCNDRLAGRSGLLYQRGVLLRNLIHLIHGFSDLLDSGGLLGTRRRNFGHDIRDPFNRSDNILQCLARLIDQRAAFLDLGDAVLNESFDLFGRRGATPSEA